MGKFWDEAESARAARKPPRQKYLETEKLETSRFIGSVPIWAVNDAIGIRAAATLDRGGQGINRARSSGGQTQNVSGSAWGHTGKPGMRIPIYLGSVFSKRRPGNIKTVGASLPTEAGGD